MKSENAVVGFLKRFDREAGYGFLVSDAVDGDVFIHIEQIRNFGISGISETARITFEFKSSDRGYAVSKIISIESHDEGDGGETRGGSTTSLRPARIKWFDVGRGFGFARCFGLDADVYVGKNVINNSSFDELKPGDAVCVRIVDAPKGVTAVALYPWEFAIPQDEQGNSR